MNYPYKLYGSILGDLAGQPHEFPPKGGPISGVLLYNPDSHFTDDTLMTLATANFLLGKHKTIEEAYKVMGKRYVGDYYGKGFKEWIYTKRGVTMNSYGNGSIMRISPYMYMEDKEKILPLILDSVLCSHRHDISIRSAIKLYDAYMNGLLNLKQTEIKNFEKFYVIADVTIDFCLNLVSQSTGTEKTIIKAIECGGDTDTNASICGELTNFYYKDIKQPSVEYVESMLDEYLLSILKEFNEKF